MTSPSPIKPPGSRIPYIITAAVALLAAGLWAVDTFVGRDQFHIVLMILLVFLGVLLFLWLLIWLVRKIMSAASAARLRRQEEQAAISRSASPEAQAELDALKDQLQTAVGVLRESKLARGRKADEALYVLPWVLMLGPSEAGKTTALRESGVDFPYTTAEGRGARSSRAACDYWFSRGAVILDLAGRIAADRDGSEIFRGFLDQLKRARRARPLDGVIVTVSLPDILERMPDEVSAIAGRLRRRLDEMIRQLGVRFPIYILFTRCDQVEGFTDFFANMRGRDREQVWGATISRDDRKRAPAEEIFSREFDALARSLSEYRLRLLAVEKDPQRRIQIYTFPWRFAALKDRVKDFIGTLLESTPYTERPMFRGFYLTGAPGMGEPEPAREVQQRWEPGRLGEEQQPTRQARSYFLENVFSRVIFADRPLATASIDTRLRRRLWVDIAFVAGALLCLMLIVGMSFSFVGNLRLIDSVRTAALRLSDAGWDGRRTTDLMAMEDLRERLEELHRYETEGPRWSLRWGLYSGERINETARRVYFRRLRDAFVSPTSEALRQRVAALSSGAESTTSYDQFYTYLKAYLMMTEPSRTEESFLNNALAPFWKEAGPRDAESIALKQLRFYTQQLPRNAAELALTRDEAVVQRARRALSQFPALYRIYTRLKNEGNSQLQPFTLAHATGGKSLEYLDSSHDVPGVFTEAGWGRYFKSSVAQASREVSRDDWVVGPTAAPSPSTEVGVDYQKQLLDLYFAEYSEEWFRFLDGISVRPMSDLVQARAALDSFSQQDSALSRVLMNVAANTMLRRDPDKGSSVTGLVSTALATLGLTSRVNREELVGAVADQFLPLHDLVTSPDGKSPSLSARYIDVLGKIHIRLESLFGAGAQWEQVKSYVSAVATNISTNEFQECYGLTALIQRQVRTKRSTAPAGSLLEQPLRQAWTAILRDAGYRLDGLWKTRVAEFFQREVENRYPFNPSGQDLPLATFAQVLRPREGLLWGFYESELKMFVTPSEGRWAPASLLGSQVDFSPEFLEFMTRCHAMEQAFFGSGAEPSVSFDLTPEPTPGVSESLLEFQGSRISYRNEPQFAQPFTWPGKSGPPQARISIALQGGGERPSIPAVDGEWAFFRLLGRARVTAQSATAYMVAWPITTSDGRRYEIRYRLQARSIQNPFSPGFFTRIQCPDRVTQLPAPGFATGFSPGR